MSIDIKKKKQKNIKAFKKFAEKMGWIMWTSEPLFENVYLIEPRACANFIPTLRVIFDGESMKVKSFVQYQPELLFTNNFDGTCFIYENELKKFSSSMQEAEEVYNILKENFKNLEYDKDIIRINKL